MRKVKKIQSRTTLKLTLAMKDLKENQEQQPPRKLSMDRIAKVVMIILILTMIYQLYLG
ncbi:hypothetical protein DFQ12_1451 [Sphingobacterium detergens]|uniref:Uncharacterized protein n=1 Tax=Sphingobacterium detergens TaxID=1145106 RepID=A0A420BIV4_SPHD1|nr:hypothetical protein DFQ12_1451 [Sphingobacterium detergens]